MSIPIKKIFVFVIASLENPYYLEMVKLRKFQLKKYFIDYIYLFDDRKDSFYTPEENRDLFFKKPIESNHLNPHMILKFLKGIALIDENKYDFILRVNLSTFINFPLLYSKLNDLPEKKLFAGHVKLNDPNEIDNTKK